MNADTTDSTTSKSKLLIIATIVALVAGCGAGLFIIWANRPINKVENALANDYDISTVNQYYDKLKEDEQTSVSERLLEYAHTQYDSYYNEETDYNTVSEIYDDLDSGALRNNSEFNVLRQSLDELKASRDNYDLAKQAYDSKDYVSAMEYYQLVSPIDPNYDLAQSMFEDSRQKNVIGQWVASIDMADTIESAAGIELDGSVSIPVEIACIFNEDGTGSFEYIIEDKVAMFSALSQAATDIIIKELARQYGVSEQLLDSVTKMLGFADISSLASSYLNKAELNSLIDEFADTNLQFTYTIGNDSIELMAENRTQNMHFEDDGSLTLDPEYAQELFDIDSINFVKKN